MYFQLYLSVLDLLDLLDVLDVLDLFDLAKVCSEKISIIEFNSLFQRSPYIWADMLRSYKWVGIGWMDLCVGLLYEHRFAVLISGWVGLGWVGMSYSLSTALRC